MSGQPADSTAFRGPRPICLVSLIGIVSIVIILISYRLIGCGLNWFTLVGLFLNVMGAVSLAVLDIPSISSHTYAEDLRRLEKDLSAKSPPPIEQDTDTHNILKSSVGEYVDFQGSVDFTINGDSLLICPEDGESERIDLLIVHQRLRRQILREKGRLRRNGIYLLAIGFGLQSFGMFLHSELGNIVISDILGIGYTIC